MTKTFTVWIAFCLLLISCPPDPTPAPALVPTQTPLPPPTDTVIPTLTPSITLPPRPSRTPSPTLTPQPNTPPVPNLGVLAKQAVDGMGIFKGYDFVDLPDIDRQSARRAEIAQNFTTITLVGDPYLIRAELSMDLSKLKDIDIINMNIISFLCSTTDCGLTAIDWARHSLPEATQKGRIEKTFGE